MEQNSIRFNIHKFSDDKGWKLVIALSKWVRD